MLRFALLVLLIANAGYLAWSQGWMATLGWAPEEQSEPYRLKQQVRPEVLDIAPAPATPAPAPSAPTPLPAPAPYPAPMPEAVPAAKTMASAAAVAQEEILPQPTICLQTENMDEAQFKQLQSVLVQNDFPSSNWQVLNTTISGRWMVYLGKFANETALEKRRAELRNRKIGYDRAGGNFEPGLSLGRFSTEEAATRELGNMLNQGIRGARVVQERAGQTLYALRFSQVTAAQQTRLQALQTAFQGKSLRFCPAS